MSKQPRKFATVEAQKIAIWGVVITALFGLIGVAINAIATYKSSMSPIYATQTAEASKALIPNPPAATTISTSTFTPEQTLPPIPSNTPTPSECNLNNLINCSTPIPVFVSKDSDSTATFISNNLVVDFNNPRNTSGVALRFTPPLDVKGFNFLEISGISTQTFRFLIEYKDNVRNQVTISTHQSFSATSTTLTVKIPIIYGNSIDELVINFFEKGQSSTFVIESIHLK